MLKLIALLVVLSVGPHLIRRKRETDSAGNPTLRAWGPFLFVAGGGIFFAWQTYQSLTDPVLSCTDDWIVDLGFVVFAFLGSAFFLYSRITLLPDRIEQRVLSRWKIDFPLSELEEINENRGGIVELLFLGNRKLPVFGWYSGRPFFTEKLRALTFHSRGPR